MSNCFGFAAPVASPPAAPARKTRLRLHDSQVVALARIACAGDAGLRAAILAGRWNAGDLARLATEAVTLGIAAGDLRPARRAAVEDAFALRLAGLLATARPVAGGFNSLAEFLGGRVADRPDRLVAVPRSPRHRT
ncbi:hypothetical protein ACQW02_15390 [Humitalea sp. 24SJ18S-53]|uniref:hypothetical protein n=1 Tax=Humitalea sp. 24SJ18S-53 TaxID=3422307 RepID=UPI003D67D185